MHHACKSDMPTGIYKQFKENSWFFGVNFKNIVGNTKIYLYIFYIIYIINNIWPIIEK